MADSADPAAKPTKKKKTLAFLRSTPKPAPTHDEESGPSNDGGKNGGKEEEDDDGLDMFRRSKHYFPVVVEEQDHRSHEASPKPRLEAEKHTPGNSDEEPIPSSSRSSKRRKLSSPAPEADHPWRTESYDELYGPATPPRRASISKTPTPASRISPTKHSTSVWARAIKQGSPSTGEGNDQNKSEETIGVVQSDLLPTPTSRSNSRQPSTDAIALDDDDDASGGAGGWRDLTPSPKKAEIQTTSARKGHAAPSLIVLDDSDDDDDDDDLIGAVAEPKEDEFAHFVAAARKKQEDAKAAAAAAAPSDHSSDAEQDPSTPNAGRARAKKRAPFIPVTIFVHSRIAAYAEHDILGFGCQRKIDQQLGPVRGAFVQYLRKKGVSVTAEMDQAIFLTWKGRRIYNSVSGLGLGWQPQGNGKLYAPEREPGFTRGGVLLEAWTEEDFERYMTDLERQRLIDRGELVGDGPGVEVEDDTEDAEPVVAKVRLFMKEKNTEPIRLTSYLDTQVRILVGAYRKQKKVPEDREIRLRYEGDWLDPEMTVEQAYIDDMCTVEVYLK